MAEELFLDAGFSAVSMDELAGRSGVCKPVIYDHFVSKEGLFGAILDQHAQALSAAVSAAVAEAEGPEGRFRAGSKAYFAWVAQRGASITVVLAGLNSGHRVGAERRVLRRNQVTQIAVTLAESLRLCGRGVDAVADAQVIPVAEMLAGASEALALWWQRENPQMSVDEVNERFCVVMWPALLSGLPVLARTVSTAP